MGAAEGTEQSGNKEARSHVVVEQDKRFVTVPRPTPPLNAGLKTRDLFADLSARVTAPCAFVSRIAGKNVH